MEAVSRMSHANSRPVPLAAFDFGSNSFHVAVAASDGARMQTLLRQGERIQLAAGIRQRRLDASAIARALDCVRRFADAVQPFGPQRLRAVATHATRIVDNADDFLLPAQEILALPVEVISGAEEARLIYRGVCTEFGEQARRRLVIDIGGGSTEIILGDGDVIERCDSLDLGCLTLKERFFAAGGFRPADFTRAVEYAMGLLAPLAGCYAPFAGVHIGTSGTLQAIAGVLHEHFGQPPDVIGKQALLAVPRELMARQGHLDSLLLKGLDQERQPVFASGLAIVTALMLQLGIRDLQIARSDLRDGVLWGLAESLAGEQNGALTSSASLYSQG
jgi:exopolyphosphatase/guanosine-5'-triphosphate,3'-diphosphate pyrophosphatase